MPRAQCLQPDAPHLGIEFALRLSQQLLAAAHRRIHAPAGPQRHRRPDADRQVGRRLEERIRVARVGRSAGQVERRQDLERHRVLAPGRRVHPGPPHEHRGVHIDGAVLHLDLARRHGRELVRVGRALGELGAGRQAVLPKRLVHILLTVQPVRPAVRQSRLGLRDVGRGHVADLEAFLRRLEIALHQFLAFDGELQPGPCAKHVQIGDHRIVQDLLLDHLQLVAGGVEQRLLHPHASTDPAKVEDPLGEREPRRRHDRFGIASTRFHLPLGHGRTEVPGRRQAVAQPGLVHGGFGDTHLGARGLDGGMPGVRIHKRRLQGVGRGARRHKEPPG